MNSLCLAVVMSVKLSKKEAVFVLWHLQCAKNFAKNGWLTSDNVRFNMVVQSGKTIKTWVGGPHVFNSGEHCWEALLMKAALRTWTKVLAYIINLDSKIGGSIWSRAAFTFSSFLTHIVHIIQRTLNKSCNTSDRGGLQVIQILSLNEIRLFHFFIVLRKKKHMAIKWYDFYTPTLLLLASQIVT